MQAAQERHVLEIIWIMSWIVVLKWYITEKKNKRQKVFSFKRFRGGTHCTALSGSQAWPQAHGDWTQPSPGTFPNSPSPRLHPKHHPARAQGVQISASSDKDLKQRPNGEGYYVIKGFSPMYVPPYICSFILHWRILITMLQLNAKDR